jgi:hypothetical protein
MQNYQHITEGVIAATATEGWIKLNKRTPQNPKFCSDFEILENAPQKKIS